MACFPTWKLKWNRPGNQGLRFQCVKPWKVNLEGNHTKGDKSPIKEFEEAE